MIKVVIIINGSGAVGKDTLCDFAAKHYKVRTISSITPIKEIASQYGWNGGKDSASRKFLADLKKAFVEYNNYPNQYLKQQYNEFLNSQEELLFVHIREPEEIIKFKKSVSTSCITLLVRRKEINQVAWGNASDDNVNDYPYDEIYDNDKSIEEAEQDFVDYLEKIIHTYG